MKRVFTAQNLRARKGGPDGKTLDPIQLVIAGASAGIANSIVSGPVEHIRIRECLSMKVTSFAQSNGFTKRATDSVIQEPSL
jgi:hypothetical protein